MCMKSEFEPKRANAQIKNKWCSEFLIGTGFGGEGGRGVASRDFYLTKMSPTLPKALFFF